jgi:hypothetical protein
LPYCIANNIEIGADVSGKPKNQPLTDGPHRLPARETRAIKTGLRNTLSVSIKKNQFSVARDGVPTDPQSRHNRFPDGRHPVQ